MTDGLTTPNGNQIWVHAPGGHLIETIAVPEPRKATGTIACPRAVLRRSQAGDTMTS